jgi:DNA-binding MarR family transcriptional regulator
VNKDIKVTEVSSLNKSFELMYFPRLVVFADVISRYVIIKLDNRVNWLTFYCLFFIYNRGGTITPTRLADLLLRPKHSITILISRLIRDKLITRKRGGRDRRTLQLNITPDGIAYLKKSIATMEMAEKDIRRCLNEPALSQLIEGTKLLRVELINKIDDKL